MKAIDDEANKLQCLQSQQPNFAWNFLPPLNPYSSQTRNSNTNISVDEINAHSTTPLLGKNYTKNNYFKAYEGLPPRKNHRRSSSDIPLGFSDMIRSSPQLIPISGDTFSGNFRVKKEEKSGEIGKLMYLDNLDVLQSSGVEDKDSECSDNEVESVNGKNVNSFSNGVKIGNLVEKTEVGVKRSYVGREILPLSRHFRSVSMDSFMDSTSLNFSLEFGNGEFTEAELRNIMGNDKLAEIALSDPKRAKRILANRQSAARSKERKTKYISELELMVQSLQTEANTLSTQLALSQKATSDLSSQNNELKIRLQAVEQEAQLKDALNEALNAEIQRLKLAGTKI